MPSSRGQSQRAESALSQASQKSVVIWPERDWDIPRKRFAKRNTTVRPVTFVRTWDSASPGPAAPATEKEDGSSVEVFLSQGDGKGSVHSDYTISPVPVIIPAKTDSEPLFEDDAEEESDDADTHQSLTSPLAQAVQDVSAAGGSPEPITVDEESEREIETTLPSQKKSTMVIAVPAGGNVSSLAKKQDSVSRKSFVPQPESSRVASFSNSLTNSNISTENERRKSRAESRNHSILSFITTGRQSTNSSRSKKSAVDSSKRPGRKSAGTTKPDSSASKKRTRKPGSLSSGSSGGKASPAKRPRTSEQRSKPTAASELRRQEEQGYRTPLTSLGGGIGLPFLSSTPRHKTPSRSRLSSEMQVLSPISGPVARVRKEKPVLSAQPPPAPPELRPGSEDPAARPTPPRGTELLVLRNVPRRKKKVTDLTDLDVLFDCIQETAADLRDQVNNPHSVKALENLVEKTAWDVQDTLAVAAEVKKMKNTERRAQARVKSSREALLSIQREYQQLRAEVIKLRSSNGRNQKAKTDKSVSTFCEGIRDLTSSSSPSKLGKNQTFKTFGSKPTADQKKSLPAGCREQIKDNDEQIRSWLEDNNPYTT